MNRADNQISASSEDYLKGIYAITGGGQRSASTGEIAERLGVAPASASTMIKRLDATGHVDHAPYHGVLLTDEGRQVALRVIRRHRLLELFLATTLDIPWNDVDRYAEKLEHSASDELIDIIARKLGDPKLDPHGDPIPTRELKIDDSADAATCGLLDLDIGQRGTLVRVSDTDPEMLRYLSEQGIKIGDELEMLAIQPFGGPCEVRVGEDTHSFGRALAQAIRVR